MYKRSLTTMLLALILLLPWCLDAISVTASANKYSLTLAERLEYSLQVSSESSFTMSEPSPPEIPNFTFVNMRSSSSSSTSISGFKSTRKITRTFIYYYIPKSVGSTKIPAQKIRIANKVYSTPEFEITVVKAAAGASSQSSPAFDPYSAFEDPGLPWSADRVQGNTMLLALLQSSRVYKGQPVIVSYYLYTDQMVRSYNLDDERDFPGYGKSTFEQPSMLNYESVSYDGKRFQRALIKRLVLLPNEVGSVQVPQLSGTARIYEFGYLSQRLVSQDKYLEVLSLPKAGAPEDFSGAVGSFKVSQTISAQELSLGEALTLSLRINGTGNFNQFVNPQFAHSNAQVSSPVAVDRLNAGIEGSRTLYYTIIPAEKGSFILPQLNFTWFDPATGNYRQYQSPKSEIIVKGANVISYFSGLWDGGKPKTLNPMLVRPVYPEYRSYLTRAWYWLLVFFILMAVCVSAYFALHKKRQERDPASYLRQQAGRKLKRYLREANEAAKHASQDFYVLAERGFMRFLCEKYSIAKGLSTAEKVQQLAENKVPDELILQSASFLERCTQARFSPDETPALQISEDLLALNQLVMAYSKLNGKGALQ